jgi:protease I
MFMGTLTGKRIAILATNGFEQSELTEPKRLLEEAGAQTIVISPESGEIKGWKEKNWGEPVHVDEALSDANEANYDALMLPGGQMNPDSLRMNPQAVHLVRSFAEAGKPIGAICHGPWMLVEAGIVDGRDVTSWPSLKTDLTNAGAHWVDKEVVTDNGIVTSRNPGDIPAFANKLIEEINEGYHDRRYEEPEPPRD